MSSRHRDPSSRISRKSAFSCETCRKRKVKCDGLTPRCSRCSARGEVCLYGLAPTLSYTRSLEKRLAELEAILALNPELSNDRATAVNPAPPLSNDPSSDLQDSPKHSPSPDEGRSEVPLDLEGLKIENDGRISVYGATSFFQLPQERFYPASRSPSLETESSGKEKLIINAWRERAFEKLANIPEPVKTLLDNHWTWIQPLFNFVYRPAFTRDMKSNGPYYSPALLNAILSHSVRWTKSDPRMVELLEPYDGGAQFYRWALDGVFADIRQGDGKIPDVQALLLLSAQECSSGHRTQAWLYIGMAFRLIQSMGLNIDGRKFANSAQYTDEDIEIRNRLYWSCYSWEKLMCLYLGKSPTIQNSPVSPPQILLDDSAEIDIWSPHGVTLPGGEAYPPTQNHATSCFTKMCSLSEILCRVLNKLYDPIHHISDVEMEGYIKQEAKRLEIWWQDLPDFLQISVRNRPKYCPPSHIATLNCLFHTIVILLHRPCLCSRPSSRSTMHVSMNYAEICISSANSIMAVFDLYRSTFGDAHVVLALGYCVYTATSIFLLEAQRAGKPSYAIMSQLRLCLEILEQLKLISPIINTALRLIYQEMQTLNIEINLSSGNQSQQSMEILDPDNTFNLGIEEPESIAYNWEDASLDTSLLPVRWGSDDENSFLATIFGPDQEDPPINVDQSW